MKITTVAHTKVIAIPESLIGTEFCDRTIEHDSGVEKDIDLLAELAGRGCYKSWSLPNPKTATNRGYLENIIEQKHYSVMEHGSITFYVEGISRAMLLELERHRFTSYSVESQRYVKTDKWHPEAVVPPAMREKPRMVRSLQRHYKRSLKRYNAAYKQFRKDGLSIKAAREASRAYLPESTAVDLFVTANVRAWRDVLGKRWSEHADAEIREFAGLVLKELNTFAPHSVLDIPLEPTN